MRKLNEISRADIWRYSEICRSGPYLLPSQCQPSTHVLALGKINLKWLNNPSTLLLFYFFILSRSLPFLIPQKVELFSLGSYDIFQHSFASLKWLYLILNIPTLPKRVYSYFCYLCNDWWWAHLPQPNLNAPTSDSHFQIKPIPTLSPL